MPARLNTRHVLYFLRFLSSLLLNHPELDESACKVSLQLWLESQAHEVFAADRFDFTGYPFDVVALYGVKTTWVDVWRGLPVVLCMEKDKHHRLSLVATDVLHGCEITGTRRDEPVE